MFHYLHPTRFYKFDRLVESQSFLLGEESPKTRQSTQQNMPEYSYEWRPMPNVSPAQCGYVHI